MKKILPSLIIALLFINSNLQSQTHQDSCSNLVIENALYLKEDLTKFLQKSIKYPRQAFLNNIQDDVIFSINIDKNGDMNNFKVINSPSKILYSCSMEAFDQIDNKWSPCKINGVPISKNYTIVFRYRVYRNSQPPKYKKWAERLIEKQKYTKALKIYNKAIKDNEFDYELLALRSKLNELLGDSKAAQNDSQQSNKLKNSILSVVNTTMTSEIIVKRVQVD